MRALLAVWILIDLLLAADAVVKSAWVIAIVSGAVAALLVWAFVARTSYWRRRGRL